MTPLVTNAISTFLELLEKRLTFGVLTTEDSIRYTFFAALLHHGIQPERVVLEYPHPTISGARVDTVIVSSSGEPATAVEFKYDRANPGGASQPLPQKAGSAFADMRRLALLPLVPERYFVYVMDRELARYLASPRNGLDNVFGLAVDDTVCLDRDYFVNRSLTFRNRLGEWPGEVVLECVAAQDLPREHCLRIYAVDRGAGLSETPQRLGYPQS
jgi:hypothetical protein